MCVCVLSVISRDNVFGKSARALACAIVNGRVEIISIGETQVLTSLLRIFIECSQQTTLRFRQVSKNNRRRDDDNDDDDDSRTCR